MKVEHMYLGVAQSILDMIDSGLYPPGARLPSERDLAVQFGVGRSVVREAEMFLQGNGRIKIKRGSGAYVHNVAKANDNVLGDVTAFGLTQTRLLFESECAAVAATRITDAQITELEQTIDTMKMAPVDSPESDKADHAFHLLIARATGNEANVVILEHIWRMRNEIDAVKRVYLAVGHKDSQDRVNEHIDVMDALRARNPAAAREAMRAHFTRLLKALIDTTEEQAIEDVRQKSDANRARYIDAGVPAYR